jgi:7,8-dihydroneopterin aldolase/epimerase/oxygenase
MRQDRSMTEVVLDTLAVTGIRCFGHHGVFEDERRDGQPFIIDLVLGVDTRLAARTDDLRDTVDYGSLTNEVKASVERDPVDLVETLAQRISDLCLSKEGVMSVTVTVHKPQAPVGVEVADVALTVTRHRYS